MLLLLLLAAVVVCGWLKLMFNYQCKRLVPRLDRADDCCCVRGCWGIAESMNA